MNTSDLVRPTHLDRKAIVYVRQSTMNQVNHHQESQVVQYALRERAVALGWNDSRIKKIDTDLGKSAATTDGREGFQTLVAEIALGNVGILIAFDATRLARNCSHWYQLLDLCSRFDCLIGDRDGLYNPASVNGRLLLGLKGQIFELELGTIRARCNAGILSRASRGEYAAAVPAGYERLEGGSVVKDPNVEVQKRIELVFAKTEEIGSIYRTANWFFQNELLVPRRDRFGALNWQPATVGRMNSIISNPAYAGAAVYGKTCSKT